VLTALDAPAVRDWATAVVAGLVAHREEIDRLNVYPVPDGDTGTNLVLTAQAAAEALRSAPDSAAGGCLAAYARGAVLGARGNSGVILAELLRGLAGTDPELSTMDGARLAAGLARAAELAYAVVAKPVEGTILTVARQAAAAAVAAAPGGLSAVVRAACAAAADALVETAAQLPALEQAGVVDAGGRGYLVILDALAGVVTGEGVLPTAPRLDGARPAARETGSTEFEYEVQYLLDAGASAQPAGLRLELATLGDSVLVVGTGDGIWNVHVHTNDIGPAIEAGVRLGRPHRIAVTRFADQGVTAAPAPVPRAEPRDGTAVLAIVPDAELAELFRAEGVLVVTGLPSTRVILAGIEASGAARVVVLPNHSDQTAVAAAAATEARAAGFQVTVIPTRSPVQGLAAVAVHDASRPFEDDTIAMAEAAAATRSAEITVAARDAITMAGRCQAGDVLGLVEGDVLLIGGSIPEVAVELVDRLLGTGGELLTLVLGADAPDGLTDLLARHLAGTHPEVELTVYEGGQPTYPILLGVE
jgi:DAK2 domain fusion protein YloV